MECDEFIFVSIKIKSLLSNVKEWKTHTLFRSEKCVFEVKPKKTLFWCEKNIFLRIGFCFDMVFKRKITKTTPKKNDKHQQRNAQKQINYGKNRLDALWEDP